MTAITVPKHEEPGPQQESTGPRVNTNWTVEQVLHAYGDFLAGRLRMPQLKSPTPLFGGKTLATLCYCWLSVTRQPTYEAHKELLKRQYKHGEMLTENQKQKLEPFKSVLREQLSRYPFAPEFILSTDQDQETHPSQALVSASLAAEILGVSVASLSVAASRGKIDNHQRRGQRLLIPVSYLRARLGKSRKEAARRSEE